MSKIYHQFDGHKSNVVVNYSIFPSMLKNHWITFAIAACHLSIKGGF